MERAAREPGLPLDGIRILDAATVIAAPVSATLLAEFGAEVIKIEQPGAGDPVRSFAPYRDAESLHWRVTNRNKKSVTLDFHTAEGRELFRRLVAESDVVVTNFRPGKLREWGIDYEDLIAVRPDIVMFHLTAFGRTGPYADRPGFARIAEAMSGLTYVTGYPDRAPVFAGYPIADGIGGFYGAYSILLALRQRDRTGEGQLIDLALYEPMLRMMEDLVVGYSGAGQVKERAGNEQPNICPNNVYPTSEGGHVILPVSTEAMWTRLVDLIGDDELRRYDSNRIRLSHREHIDRRIAEFTAQFTLEKVLRLLEDHEIACGKLYSVADILDDPHIRHRENLVEIDDEELGVPLTVQAPVPRCSAMTPVLRPAPRLGEHNDDVFGGLLGITPDVLADYRSRTVI